MKSKYLLLAFAFLASCSQEQIVAPEDDTQQEESLQGDQHSLSIKPFKMQTGGQTSRTTPNITDETTSYTWNTGDEIGIFPFEGETPKGDQVWFKVTAKEDASKATFDGGGWQIKEGMNYHAYYPFIDKFRMDPKAMDVTFAGQAVKGKDDYSNFGKYDYMVAAPKQQATVDGGMSFEFDHVTALCVIRFQMLQKMLKDQTSGKLKCIDLILPETENLFCETANLDLTKGKNALTAKTTTNKISIDLTGYQIVGKTGLGGIVMYEEVMIPFLQGPAQLADKTCEVKLVVHDTSDQEIGTYTTTLKFQENLACGNGYFLDLTFPNINVEQNYIYSHTPGSLTLDRVHKAMNGGNKLRVEGEVCFNDIDVLRQAATAAKTKAAGTPTQVLTDLDVKGVRFFEGKQAHDAFVRLPIDFPSLAGTQLTRLILPGDHLNLKAETFKDVPLQTLEWPSLRTQKGTLDPKAFDGLVTTNCDLVIQSAILKYISADADGNMLFNGCKFKSIKEGKEVLNPDIGEMVYVKEDIKTSTVNADAHSIDAHFAGFLTETTITEALGAGTTLKVTGKLNDRDLTTIAAYKAASITSLTFDNVGEYLPTAANVFEGCTYSEGCDLVIPDTWKSKVSVAGGKVMFGGLAWKSIKDTTGKNIIDSANPNPGIDLWTPGEGGDLEAE